MRDQPAPFVDGDGFEQIPIGQVAARIGIVHQSLARWAKKGTLPTGQPFHFFRSTEGWLYIREDTVMQMEERFVKLPGKEPAGRITIGITPDQSGFVPVDGANALIKDLGQWISRGKLDALVKDAAAGRELSGLHLDLVADPFHRNSRYASEKSLRGLMNAEAQAKFYPRTGKPSPLHGRPR